MKETDLQRIRREAHEAEQAALAEPVVDALPPEPPKTREVIIVLRLTYDALGACVGTVGVCNGREVLRYKGAGDLDLGHAAQETLRLGALGALLGP